MNKKPLTQVEKDYIKLYLSDLQRTKGRIDPSDFEVLAEKLGKSVETIKNFASQQPEVIQEEAPKKAELKLTHMQETIRNTVINKTASGRSGVAVMSDAASTMIAEQNKIRPNPVTPKYERNIYRGNK